MKRPIKWHEECLRDSIKNYNSEFQNVQGKLGELACWQNRNEFYIQQIETAKKQNKEGFDNEKFLIRRGKK
jgi:hypothetical protein